MSTQYYFYNCSSQLSLLSHCPTLSFNNQPYLLIFARFYNCFYSWHIIRLTVLPYLCLFIVNQVVCFPKILLRCFLKPRKSCVSVSSPLLTIFHKYINSLFIYVTINKLYTTKKQLLFRTY